MIDAKSEIRTSALRQQRRQSIHADNCSRTAKSKDELLVCVQLCGTVGFHVVVNRAGRRRRCEEGWRRKMKKLFGMLQLSQPELMKRFSVSRYMETVLVQEDVQKTGIEMCEIRYAPKFY